MSKFNVGDLVIVKNSEGSMTHEGDSGVVVTLEEVSETQRGFMEMMGIELGDAQAFIEMKDGYSRGETQLFDDVDLELVVEVK